jgi:hypothetical protein
MYMNIGQLDRASSFAERSVQLCNESEGDAVAKNLMPKTQSSAFMPNSDILTRQSQFTKKFGLKPKGDLGHLIARQKRQKNVRPGKSMRWNISNERGKKTAGRAKACVGIYLTIYDNTGRNTTTSPTIAKLS